MNAKQLFDYIGYFKGLWERNKLAQAEKFKWCTCSGIETLQGPLQQFRTANAFFCVDDTNDGATFRGRNGGWFKKRTVTVFLLHRYSMKDMSSYETALEKCRKLMQQLLTRMLTDEDALEDISGEYIGVDEKLAVESLLRVIEGGGSENGIAKARETYEFVTGDEFESREAAEKWLAEEYEPPEDGE